MNRKLEFTVPEEYEGKKAFYFLRGCAGISARALSSLKRVDGGITRGGETLRTIDRLHAGDIVIVTLPVETETVEPMDINIDVIYEDADLLAVNKSPFLAMPSGRHARKRSRRASAKRGEERSVPLRRQARQRHIGRCCLRPEPLCGGTPFGQYK